MELHELQILVANFVARAHIDTGEPYRMLDLVSEMGEVSKEILKGTDYGKKPFNPPSTWTEELGVVMFSLLCLANKTGVDLEAASSMCSKNTAGESMSAATPAPGIELQKRNTEPYLC
ncbi:MAG: MazG nucleotide pyrophosphohydrolase domain-containing protein [candidate division KSB1 bacterium]|nr:MazG nucleotide pyrophosphohydrolase domain-containing protein [candidate division KSB1 bacterium]